MRLQERFEFVFKRMLAMMFFLITNVAAHPLNLRFANGESSEAWLAIQIDLLSAVWPSPTNRAANSRANSTPNGRLIPTR